VNKPARRRAGSAVLPGGAPGTINNERRTSDGASLAVSQASSREVRRSWSGL